MERVYSSPDLGEVTKIASVLEEAGIPVVVGNSALPGSGLGAHFGVASWPEVRLQRPEDLARAQEIISDWTDDREIED